MKSGFMQVASDLHHLPFRATKESEKSKWKKCVNVLQLGLVNYACHNNLMFVFNMKIAKPYN